MTETLAAPVSTDLLNDIVKAALKAGADAAEAVSADRRSPDAPCALDAPVPRPRD